MWKGWNNLSWRLPPLNKCSSNRARYREGERKEEEGIQPPMREILFHSIVEEEPTG